MSDTACSSYQRFKTVCRDGFIQVPNCREPNVCAHCGVYAGAAPYCMRDELPAHLSKPDGKTLFRHEPAPGGSA